MKKIAALMLAGVIALGSVPPILSGVLSASAAEITPDAVSGLKVWYDATDLKLKDGDAVTRWENKAGDHRFDAVQANTGSQPVFTASSKVNGKAGVVLSDAAYLQLENSFDLNDMSIFAVVHPDRLEGGGDDNQIFSKLANTDPWNHNWYFNIKDAGFNFGWKDAGGFRDYTGENRALTANTSYILAGVKQADQGRLYINGETIGSLQGNTGNSDAVHNDQPIYIGGAGAGKSMDGAVCEIIAFDRGLSQEETAGIHDYLSKKWGIRQENAVDGEIRIGGEPLRAFHSKTLHYKHTLPKGTAQAPEVTADFGGARVEIEQAKNPNSTASVTVEKDGVRQTYTIEFSVMEKELLNLNKPQIEQVKITDGFWREKLDLFSTTTVNHVFDNFEATGTLQNFQNIGTDGASPSRSTDPWNDGLLFEAIRGASDFLRQKPDAALQARIDGYIDIVYDAAMKSGNGYLSTWAMMERPGQYFDGTGNAIQYHDAYNFGCMAEAAVHYYKATGKTKLLYVVTRFAEFIADNYGYGQKADGTAKINMVPSHEGPEEMLLKLYELYRDEPELKAKIEAYNPQAPLSIDENEYADLVKFWIENRGNYEGRVNGANYGIYAQDHARYFDQTRGEGHAVRANLFYTGMAAAGIEFKDYTYLSTADTIWHHIRDKQMYITGGVGAEAADEAYGADYDLPNDGYCETCAQVAMGFLSENLSRAFGGSEYQDVLERYLYEGALGCVGENGKTFYYQQPLSNVNNARWNWLEHTPCCPPMFLKFYSELPSYIYSYDDSSVYLNQFISSQMVLDNGLTVTQTTDMPWGGTSKVSVTGGSTILRVRIPNWVGEDAVSIQKNSTAYDYTVENGYALVKVADGETVEIQLPMKARRVYSNEQIEANQGKVSLAYGPLVYTFEQDDNAFIPRFGSGEGNLGVPADGKLTASYNKDLLGGVVTITVPGEYYDYNGVRQSCTLTAIPFFARSNRESSTSFVWVDEQVKASGGGAKSWMAMAEGTTNDFGNSPAAAFDGNASTCWKSGSTDEPQILAVDLGDVKSIGKVSLSFLEARVWNYTVLTSKDGRSFQEFAVQKNASEKKSAYENAGNTDARYVAVLFSGVPRDDLIAVNEMAVYAPGKDQNLAKAKSCGATSSYNPGSSVFAMIDGDPSTRYCPTGVEKPQTLVMDLGEIASVTGMSILFEKPSQWSYAIQISTDGVHYTDYQRETFHMTQDGTVRNIDKAAKARYVKLSITGTTDGVWGSVWEFDVKTQTPVKSIFQQIVQSPLLLDGPDGVVEAGKTVTLSTSAQNVQNLQWQVDQNDGNGFVPLKGETGKTLSFTAQKEQNGYRYRLMAERSGETVFSDDFVLTVKDPSESSEPSEPSNPSTPSEPSGPSDPSAPSKPEEPSDPGKPQTPPEPQTPSQGGDNPSQGSNAPSDGNGSNNPVTGGASMAAAVSLALAGAGAGAFAIASHKRREQR